jgi:hypothetical protein
MKAQFSGEIEVPKLAELNYAKLKAYGATPNKDGR